MALILASTSSFRRAILENAGLACTAIAPEIDERAAEAPLVESGATPADVAVLLAQVKALDVSSRHPGALVIGADQTLAFEGAALHKSPDMDDARRKLLRLSGKTHQLHSGVAIARDGEILWEHVSSANMTMRTLSPGFIGRYLAACGPDVLRSVGVYAIEGRGIQLFDRVDGDHFTIIGMPLLPLLEKLRQLGEADA